MEEIWKDIPGYEGRNQASTEGRIRVLDHYTTFYNKRLGHDVTRLHRGRVLRPGRFNKAGHVSVVLRHGEPGIPVHQLVALAFLGPRPVGCYVCHQNGDPTDNRLENLRYDTPAENLADIYRQNGVKFKRFKLSIKDVVEIRELLEKGISQTKIARMFGITQAAVSGIKRGVNYWWLTDEFIKSCT